ncbi:MAG: PD-(D/E)XK nuclease family protein [Bdellovibrio sp.]|nr:MAG: PD-(D/E)XK nuclease family protein [Bdellovibrio sp.]
MLQEVHSFQDRMDLLDELPSNFTWVVSDLISKFELQKRFLEKSPFLEESAVLRATELWKKTFLRVYPKYQLLSKPFSLILIKKWLKEAGQGDFPGLASSLYEYVEFFLPAFSLNSELMEEWLEANEETQKRWKNWWTLSRLVWGQFLKEKKLPVNWVPGFLSLFNGWEGEFQGRYFVFDLGEDLSGVEVDLIRRIEKVGRVKVLAPVIEKTFLSENYSRLQDRSYHREERERLLKGEIPSHYQFIHMTTMVSEVKAVTGQVRSWLEQGVPPDKIAILAPDIETYWPALKAYLKEEGIPFNKGTVARLQTFLPVQQWVSRMHLYSGHVENSFLESVVFSENESLNITYSEFKKQFSNLYGEDQLPHVYAKSKKASDQLFSREEFLRWAYSFWKGPSSLLEKVFSQMVLESVASEKLPLKDWVEYVQRVVGQIEEPLEKGTSGGVFCVNFAMSSWLDVSHAFVMGLSEELLKQNTSIHIHDGDVLKLERDLGCFLNLSQSHHREKALYWFLCRDLKEVIFSAPASHFSGSPLAPSAFWVQGHSLRASEEENFYLPPDTLWDQVQKLKIDDLITYRKWEGDRGLLLKEGFLQDIGEKSLEKFGQKEIWKLSASSMDTFWSCPFKFAAEKVFGLEDYDIIDVDLSYRDKGSLLHAILEEIITEPFRVLSQEELKEKIRQVQKARRLQGVSESLEEPYISRLAEELERLMLFEKEHREKRPYIKTVGKEVWFEGYWDLEKRQWSQEKTPIVFRGKIDRIDQGEGESLCVLDYKSSEGSLTNSASWIKNGQSQMLIYATVLEQLYSKGKVCAALYYIPLKQSRQKGFILKEERAVRDFLWGTGDGPALSEETYKKLKEDFFEALQEKLIQIQEGEFYPKPMKKEECQRCRWKWVCRSPHL